MGDSDYWGFTVVERDTVFNCIFVYFSLSIVTDGTIWDLNILKLPLKHFSFYWNKLQCLNHGLKLLWIGLSYSTINKKSNKNFLLILLWIIVSFSIFL